MDAPYSRRALLSAGTAAGAVTTAGCVGHILPDDESPDERTIAGIVIGNRQDRPIEVTVVLGLQEELEFWETIELTTSDGERDHVIDGPWHAAPGDLRVLARYRPVDDASEIPRPRVNEFTLDGYYEGCMAISASITDQWGLGMRPIDDTTGDSAECAPLSEW